MASECIEIKIKSLRKEIFSIKIAISASVDDLKSKINEMKGIDKSAMRLLFKGKVLKKGPLSPFKIKNGDTLNLIISKSKKTTQPKNSTKTGMSTNDFSSKI